MMSGTPSSSSPVVHSNMTPDGVQIITAMENTTLEDTTVEGTATEEEQADSQAPGSPNSSIADGPATKLPIHQRIIQRISRARSFTSIWGTSGRERSSSDPSCISLSISVTPSTSTSNALSPSLGSAAVTVISLAPSQPESPPTTPFPDFPHALEKSQSSNAIRKIDLTTLPGGPSTLSLPAVMARTASSALVCQTLRPRPQFMGLWEGLPYELKLKVLSFVPQKDLIRASATNRSFHKACLDGQLWRDVNSLVLNNKMPIESIQSLMTKAGPFMKRLSLRGYRQTQAMEPRTIDRANCTNLQSLALEGSSMSSPQLRKLLQANNGLCSLDLKGLDCVDDVMCHAIAECCPKLVVLDLSWCKNITPRGVTLILKKCRELRDIRLAEMPQFELDRRALAVALHEVKRIQHLDFTYCKDITNESMEIIMHGLNPPRDAFTDKPLVSQRYLRHLDISHCPHLTNRAIEVVGQCAPVLESLIVTGLSVTADGFKSLLATAQHLRILDLDDVNDVNNALLVDGIAKAPMARSLRHLSLSSCEHITDDGVIAVLRACPNLQTLRLDGTGISDWTLFVAADAMRDRKPTPCSEERNIAHPAHVGLSMDIFDCNLVTWEGIEQIMKINNRANDPKLTPGPAYSTPIVQLKCYHGWQQVVRLHTARVMSGSGGLADRLAKSWVAYMDVAYLDEDDTGNGLRLRLRARRERITALEQFNQTRALAEANHERDDDGVLATRMRSRTMECAIM